MFVRMTTIKGESSRVDALIGFVRGIVEPVVDGLDGSLGLACLVDRDTGRAVVNTVWTTAEARAASREAVAPLRSDASKILSGPAYVEELAIQAGTSARPTEPGFRSLQTRLRVAPEILADLVTTFETTALPAFGELAGFCSAVLLTDRDRGIAILATTWDGVESLEAARDACRNLCGTVVSASSAEILDVWEAEVAVAGIRRPQQHEGAMRRMYAALSDGGDLDELDVLCAPHIVDHALPPTAGQGLEGVKTHLHAYRAAFPDLRLQVVQYLEQGDLACAVVRMTGTHTGPFLGIPPTRRRMDVTAIDVARFAHGRCVEHWGVEDGLTMVRQLDLQDIPSPRASSTVPLPSEVRT